MHPQNKVISMVSSLKIRPGVCQELLLGCGFAGAVFGLHGESHLLKSSGIIETEWRHLKPSHGGLRKISSRKRAWTPLVANVK